MYHRLNPELISVDKLLKGTQSDIVDTLSDITGIDSYEIRDNLIGLEPSVRAVLWYPKTKKMLSQFSKDRGVSVKNVSILLGKLISGVNLNPILTDNGKFLDGGHRVVAYFKYGSEEIPAIDIGHIMEMNWNKWIDGSMESKELNDLAEANIGKLK